MRYFTKLRRLKVITLLIVIFISNHNFLKASENDTIEIYLLIDTAKKYQISNSDTALMLSKKALVLANKAGYIFKTAEAENIIASIFETKNLKDSALVHHKKIVELLDTFLTIDSDKEIAILLSSTYNDIAEIHIDIGNVDKALDYNQRSIDINIKYDILNRQVNSLITKGKIYYSNKDLDSAEYFWNKGLLVSESIEDNDLTGRLLNNLGSISYHNNDWHKGLIYFKKAYDLQIKINNETEIVRAANNIGLSYFILEDYIKSLPFYLEALHLAEKHSMGESQLIALNYLTQIYTYLNKPDKARESFLKFGSVIDEYFASEQLKVINEIEIKYEVDKKNKEIELLEKQKIINEFEYNQKLGRKNKIIIIVIFSIVIIALIIWIWLQNFKKQQAISKQNLQFQKVVTEQKMLRSQMNPHFIYNSLNSIQSFISSDDSYQAEKYLARFAKLMRGFLENSRENFVLLKKEIDVIQLFLELEQLRFDNNFKFEIKIDENIDTEYISIPPMLIQPFAENAILHGLRSMNNGFLSISLTEKDESIICIIDDNGVGRKVAGERKQQNKHISLASSITKERMDVLSEWLKQPASFTIEDKFENNEPSGTRVVIQMPFQEI